MYEPLQECCAVCDDRLEGGGVKFNKLFTASNFNLNHSMANINSAFVCNHCAVFFSKKNWLDYCDRNKKDAYFPKVDGKERSLANWVFFSHYFATNDHRIVKTRQDWREYLTHPPKPPFCFVLSAMCKKHLIFKAEMAYNRDEFPILFEENKVFINRESFTGCLFAFEKLYNAGLSKSSIRTGDYSSSALLAIDKELLYKYDPIISEYRRLNPDYLAVCEFIGGKDAG